MKPRRGGIGQAFRRRWGALIGRWARETLRAFSERRWCSINGYDDSLRCFFGAVGVGSCRGGERDGWSASVLVAVELLPQGSEKSFGIPKAQGNRAAGSAAPRECGFGDLGLWCDCDDVRNGVGLGFSVCLRFGTGSRFVRLVSTRWFDLRVGNRSHVNEASQVEAFKLLHGQ